MSRDTTVQSREATNFDPPDPMTQACDRFMFDYWELAVFYRSNVMMYFERDEIERRFARAMLTMGGIPENRRDALERQAVVGIGASQALEARSQMLTQLILCRAVDNYVSYISELLGLI